MVGESDEGCGGGGWESPIFTEFWDSLSEFPEEDYFCDAPLPTR